MPRKTFPPRSAAGTLRRRATLLAATALALGACGGEDEPPARPNVLLISIDTLRADHLGSYGYARDTSPRLDRLARGGVLFEDAVSTTSWTLPAHLSLLTGLELSVHGVCDDRLWQLPGSGGDSAEGGDGPAASPLRGTFLPEVLHAAGYRTAGFFSWKYLETRFGFGPGFDVYERVGHSIYSHPEWGPRFQAMRAAGDADGIRRWMEAQPELFDEQRPTSDEAVDRALTWLATASEPGAPFFLFLHLFDVHDDYVPPPPFDTRFDPDYDGPIDGRRVSSPDSPVHAGMPARDLEHLIALYDGEIAWVDSQVGRVLDWLDERELSRNTLLVVTSDHGEEFFEHGGKTHRAGLHAESVHVPLILRWPAGIEPGSSEGRRIEGPVGIVDVAPTIYGLLGLSAPAAPSGTDLSRIARGERPNEPREYVSELLHFDEGWTPERQLKLSRGDERILLRTPPTGLPSLRVYAAEQAPLELGPGREVTLGGPEAAEISKRIQALRARMTALRNHARERGLKLDPLTGAELSELGNMGYASSGGEDGPDELGPGSRLCLDGCVWPDE